MVDTLLERVAPADLDSVSSLRRATDAFLQKTAEDQFRAAVLLVVSELSTNAVEALGGEHAAEFTLRVQDFADRVEIEVKDDGPGFADALGKPGASADNPRGRGLQIVRGIVDEFCVRRRNGCTEVCCVMRRANAA